jgi:hypothetical protein
MQTSILQVLVLVARANYALAGQDLGDFYLKESVFQGAKRINFVDLSADRLGNWIETPWADNPAQWIERLKEIGASGTRVLRLSQPTPGLADRLAVALAGGGGRWMIEVEHSQGFDYWESRWDVVDGMKQVTYGRVLRNHQRVVTKPPFEEPLTIRNLSDWLTQILLALAEIAEQQQLKHFAQIFREASLILTDPNTGFDHVMTYPSQVKESADRLLAACLKAWVFGGMGSWNDVVFDENLAERAESLSDDLFAFLCLSLVEGINQTYPSAIPLIAKERTPELSVVDSQKKWWQFWR